MSSNDWFWARHSRKYGHETSMSEPSREGSVSRSHEGAGRALEQESDAREALRATH